MTTGAVCTRPDVVIRPDAAGRFRAQCLSCAQGSQASFHKPISEQWRDAHNRRGVA